MYILIDNDAIGPFQTEKEAEDYRKEYPYLVDYSIMELERPLWGGENNLPPNPTKVSTPAGRLRATATFVDYNHDTGTYNVFASAAPNTSVPNTSTSTAGEDIPTKVERIADKTARLAASYNPKFETLKEYLEHKKKEQKDVNS